MKRYIIGASVGVAVVLLVLWGLAARSGGDVASAPWRGIIPQPDVLVKAYPSYAQDIQPIFNEFCISCHGTRDAHNGLQLDSYDGTTKGTRFGSVIVPGDPAMSPLMTLIKRESAPEIWMPYHKEQLSPNRIKNIENWVRYGARNN